MERAPIRRGILRRIPQLGADRRVIGPQVTLLGALGFTLFNGYGFAWGLPIVVPLVIFLPAIWILRSMYEYDPYLIDTVWEAVLSGKYRRFYSAKCDLDVEQPVMKDWV